MLQIAVDAMGGDNAPEAVLEGVRLAREQDIDIVLVGNPDDLDADTLATYNLEDIELIEASQAIPMDAEPGSAVRTMKDSSLNRAAEAVRDGKASAIVSAGNTGATMAAALLKMGRIKGVARPAIATPFFVRKKDTPNIMLDCGANAEAQPEWLGQFAKMGVVYTRDAYGVKIPKVGLMSIGEEASKGSSLVKNSFEILSQKDWQKELGCEFIGNIEGRDLLVDSADVLVTDGFTGNVVLKTAEGVATEFFKSIVENFGSPGSKATDPFYEAMEPVFEGWNPNNTGGAVLLGVKGVCVIAHGSSNPTAILNAIVLARDSVANDNVQHLKDAIS